MPDFMPLLADIEDLIKGLVPLVILVIWVLRQVLGGKAERPVVGEARPKPAQPGAPPPPKDDLRDQIEAFLKQATQPKPQKPRTQAEAARRKAAQAAARASAEVPVEAELVEESSSSRGGPAGEGVARHVQRHLDTASFRQRAAHLGEEVGQADEKLEERLHEKFDHSLGKLASPATTKRLTQSPARKVSRKEEQVAAPAAQIIAIFRDPEKIRQAIVLNEILRRPEERW